MDTRVRFAPSPTGELHIGGVRTALFNWLFARSKGGKFILRIDDTDRQRSSEVFLQSILDSFRWLNLTWDEGPEIGGVYGPYRQSERLSLYREEAERLLASGNAYPCFCTAEDLETQREKCRSLGLPPRYNARCRTLTVAAAEEKKNKGQAYVIRAVTPAEGVTVVDDIIRGKVTFLNKVFDDPIIIRSDGLPTYNFASVVDDFKMEITHVIRAEEHLSNTPRQQIIAGLLGYAIPYYAHVPMILAPDHSKLSKRHGATSVQEYRDQGILPEALLNYLALLGWSPGEDREILSMDDMIKLFSLERVSKNPAIYDMQKLIWLNSHYLRTGKLEQIVHMTIPILEKEDIISPVKGDEAMEKVAKVVELVREKVKTLTEIAEASRHFFKDEVIYDEKAVDKHFKIAGAAQLLQQIHDILKQVDPFLPEDIEEAIGALSRKMQVPLNRINPALRLALTGNLVGPELYPLVSLLGKDKVLQRLEKAQGSFMLTTDS